MSTKGLQLTERDRRLLDFLLAQGSATFSQLRRRHFTSDNAAIKRIIKLEEAKYVRSTTLRGFLDYQKYFPYLLELGLKSNTKIYFVSSQYRKLFPDTNRLLKMNMLLHQLYLNEVYMFLETQVRDVRFILSDPKVQRVGEHQPGRRKEVTPDLSVENADYVMAVEMERTQKTLHVYIDRMDFFRKSLYTHVLYYYVNDNQLNSLLKASGQTRKFAFAHIHSPNELFTKAWGYLTLMEWMAKVVSITSKPIQTVSTSSEIRI